MMKRMGDGEIMETQVGLKTIAMTLFLNLYFYFLLQLLCVMISHWLTVLQPWNSGNRDPK